MDIAYLKYNKLQESLKESERRYRCIFEGSMDMIFITLKDGSFEAFVHPPDFAILFGARVWAQCRAHND